MENLYGLFYLKNGDVTLRLLLKYQEEVRKAINTGQPSAPVRLNTPPALILRLTERLKIPEYLPL